MNKFEIKTLAATENPQQLCYLAMHQCYYAYPVYQDLKSIPNTEKKAGELLIKHLLKGDRGHFGCLEHPQITVNVCNFPHSLMQQIRTHRVGISIDCQSFRYTSQSILDVANGKINTDNVFYIRPPGFYTNRQGKKYVYTAEQRNLDLTLCFQCARRYQQRIEEGVSEEHARSLINMDIKQNFVLSLNSRSLQHILDLRWKADAQLEAQQFSELLFNQFQKWMPEIAEWYYRNRAKKAKLAP